MRLYSWKGFTYILGLILGSSLGTSAQERLQVRGAILDAESGRPVAYATIIGQAGEPLAIADDAGNFSVRLLAGSYEVTVSAVGYQAFQTEFVVHRDTAVTISLRRRSFTLAEVTVTAGERGLGSVSVIDRQAIAHTQAYSIKDALQLIPGQLASNPNLLSPQRIMIRQVSTSGNQEDNYYANRASAMGTQLMLDGVPLSNNANMQFDPHVSFPTAAGDGFDLRGMAADHIESIDVIRGIAPARYGDFTSGVINVNSRLGGLPPEANVRISPDIFQVTGSMGPVLDERNILNVNFDYLSAAADRRRPIQDYRRLSGMVAWQHRTAGVQQLHKLSAYTTFDETRSDPNSSWYASPRYSRDRQVSWMSRVVTQQLGRQGNGKLEAVASVTYQRQSGWEEYYVSRDAMLLSDALVDTVAPGFYGETNYLSATTVDGSPLNLYGLVHTEWRLGRRSRHHLSGGAEYRLDANFGAGRLFDVRRPPNLSGNRGARPEGFTMLHPMHQLALYVEDHLSYRLFGKAMQTRLGARADQLLVGQGNALAIGPRLNHRMELASGFHLHFGAGIMAKMPTLSTIYRGSRYVDLISLNHFATNPEERLGIVTTRVFNLTNEHLRPYRSRKFEIGLQWNRGEGYYTATAYHETTTEAYGSWIDLRTISYPVFGVQDRPVGQPPLLYPTPVREGLFFAGISRPANNQAIINRGVEYTLEFPRISAIRTTVFVNGLLGYSRNYDEGTLAVSSLHLTQQGLDTEFIPVYESSEGTHNIRANTSIRAVHHISRIGFVFSVLWQTIWRESFRYQDLSPYPVALANRTGYLIPIHPHEAASETMKQYHRPLNLRPSNLPPLHLVNLRATKEWKNRARFSFFVNNLFNSRPLHFNGRTSLRQRRNDPLFFGAEVSLMLDSMLRNKN